MVKFEVFDHTADVGIRAYGEDVNRAFENAAIWMFSLIADMDSVRPVGEYRIQCEAPDLKLLLVNWLSELLFLHSTFFVVFSSFSANIRKIGEKWQMEGFAKGEKIDSGRHQIHTEIKAVTHHLLEVVTNKDCKIQVLFDI